MIIRRGAKHGRPGVTQRFVVFGYGSVGCGIARVLRRLGGHVTVVEPDSVRALEVVLDGRRITLLAAGEMLNLAGGGGNPIETMDLGFSLQAHSLAYLAKHYRDLPHGPQPVPAEINAIVARWMVEELSRPNA